MKLHALVLAILGFSATHAHAKSAPLQVFVAGDVLLGRGVAATLESPDNSLQKWRKEISAADIAFCNLECAMSAARPLKSTQLLAPPAACKYLQRAGFDLLSTANNHALDAAEDGVRLAQKVLSPLKIATIGSRQDEKSWTPYRVTIRGQRVAFLAASAWGPFQKGAAQVRPLAGSNLIEQVRALTQAGERVLVSLHWGTEYASAPREGQKRTARALIDAGALAVIGHHPHVAQVVETYRGRPIFYSLGNFLFDRTPQTQSGIAALISIDDARKVSWRNWHVQPSVAENNAKNRAVSTFATPDAPNGESVMARRSGHFLSGETRPQIVMWSKPKSGPHRLRLLLQASNGWRVMAQGFHAAIWSLQIGDIDGNGRDDIVVGLMQRAKLDTQIKRRLHIYDVDAKRGFRPLWRGSALSRPFRQFVLLPREHEKAHEKAVDVVAIETNPLPEYRGFEWLAVYRWNGFGLKLIWDTPVRGEVSELRTLHDARGTLIRFRQKSAEFNRTLSLRMRHNAKGVIDFKVEVDAQ